MQPNSSTFKLPFPPSVNNLFTGRGRRYPSASYKAWRHAAGISLKVQKAKAVRGRVDVRIELRAPDRRHRDADNYLKGIIDLMAEHGLIDGDTSRHVRSVSARWSDATDLPGARVTIEPAT